MAAKVLDSYALMAFFEDEIEGEIKIHWLKS
jgi:hypothetical protein